ncbi:hypothetical protein FRAAL2467 [Frankia alni ACN14a]|uniref:Uncharacterized protein n=1 Tax=Frankia alni (strain DSM 45986 / CECT 9034 / ACN14a) TaxID=326424 RepID=Q0RAM2_FRAAA|nr:hypothetical protein FRAAL2467 [Frankia alni ACN14a]
MVVRLHRFRARGRPSCADRGALAPQGAREQVRPGGRGAVARSFPGQGGGAAGERPARALAPAPSARSDIAQVWERLRSVAWLTCGPGPGGGHRVRQAGRDGRTGRSGRGPDQQGRQQAEARIP